MDPILGLITLSGRIPPQHLTKPVEVTPFFEVGPEGFVMTTPSGGRLHYAPELRSAMNEAEVASRLPAVLARLNPAGQGLASNPKTIAPRTWVDAVENAFGVVKALDADGDPCIR